MEDIILNKKIHEIETDTTSTKTYKEYIIDMEKKLGNSRLDILGDNKELDEFANEDIFKYKTYLKTKDIAFKELQDIIILSKLARVPPPQRSRWRGELLFYFNLLLHFI